MAGAQQTSDLFLKTSSFARYLLDEVLPAQVCNNKICYSDILENLVKECDALVISLRTFKQLTNASLADEIVSTNSQINDVTLDPYKSDDPQCGQFSQLCEFIRNKVACLSDINKVKPYYCKICNSVNWNEEALKQHFTSKSHVEQCKQTPEALAIHICKHCHLLIMAPQGEISIIESTPEHRQLDSYLQILKRPSSKSPTKNGASTQGENLDKVIHGSTSEITSNNCKSDVPEMNLVPHKVNQLFQVMKKRLTSGTLLTDVVPHYCNLCDVKAYCLRKFLEHCSSKDHISAMNTAIKPINILKCEKCGFLITGYQNVIDGIIKSMCHQELDQYLGNLKTSNENVSLLGVDASPNINICEETSNHNSIPTNFKCAITSLREKLRFPSDLKKNVPSYCYTCNKLFCSNNDFKQHLASKKHKSQASTAESTFYDHSCSTCFISVCGTEEDVCSVLNSSEHNNLHKKIKHLFLCDQELFGGLDKSVSDSNIDEPSSEVFANNFVRSSSNSNNNSLLFREVMSVSNPSSCCFSQKNLDNILDSDNKPSPSKPLDKDTSVKFLTINSKLQSGNFTKSGFCGPCNKGVNIMKGWSSHLSSKRHNKAMTKLQVENVQLSCSYCPFQVLGEHVFADICVDTHINLNHQNEELNEDQSVISNNVEMETFSARSETSEQSKSTESSECRESGVAGHKLQLIAEKKSSSLTREEFANIHTSIPCTDYNHDSTSVADTDMNPSESKDHCKEVFIEFLRKKKAVFLNEGLKQFGGMCLLCAQTFDDYYDWLIHLKSPCRNIDRLDIFERDCSNCNLSLYGRNIVIENDFWPLKEHISLDALVNQ